MASFCHASPGILPIIDPLPWTTSSCENGSTKFSVCMLYAHFTTSEGNFTARLFDAETPNTVANFTGLADGSKEWTDPRSGQRVKQPYFNGTVFHRVIADFMQGLNQGAEAVRAFRNGRTRFTFSMTVDARLQRSFRLGSRRQVTAIIDAYNLFNQALEVEEFSVTGAASRLTSAVQPPRVVQIGARIAF